MPSVRCAHAAASEARWRKSEPQSDIDGVPATIKDIILTKGWPTLRGSRTVDPAQEWNEDAPAVARLREAGVGSSRQDDDSRIRMEGGLSIRR